MASKPSTYKKLSVHKRTTNFREAVSIETVKMCRPQKGEVCIKNKYVGINASDINITKGRYFSVGEALPFDIGVEGVGVIVKIGKDVKDLKVGQNVAYKALNRWNAYAEYSCVSEEVIFPITDLKPDYLVLLVSGLTSSIGLDKSARIVAGETVLITAAAGGAGHVAVQWAKAADCHVIGTCSTEEKEKLLKDLGCDRVVNYKKEDLDKVLTEEYKDGINVAWETIGGEVFQTCLKHLARKGRLVIVGGITGYKSEDKDINWNVDLSALPQQLLFKSTAVLGFLMSDYKECYATYYKYLSENLENGKLRAVCDTGEKTTGREFYGMEGIIKAVEHLHSGKNIGKVIARIS